MQPLTKKSSDRNFNCLNVREEKKKAKEKEKKYGVTDFFPLNFMNTSKLVICLCLSRVEKG